MRQGWMGRKLICWSRKTYKNTLEDIALIFLKGIFNFQTIPTQKKPLALSLHTASAEMPKVVFPIAYILNAKSINILK